jgi:hypothetical protein
MSSDFIFAAVFSVKVQLQLPTREKSFSFYSATSSTGHINFISPKTEEQTKAS